MCLTASKLLCRFPGRQGVLVQALETGNLVLKEERDVADRTVTMLGYDELRHVGRFFAFLLVIIFPVQKSYDICVLLQRTGFTQITQHRPFTGTAFHTTA